MAEAIEEQYPDCFKDSEYGVSGGNCPECGTDEYEVVDTERDNSDLVALRCVSCGLVYEIREDLVSGQPVSH
jgi:uncharacterized Zn finger protein